jgi:hypothetical protein
MSKVIKTDNATEKRLPELFELLLNSPRDEKINKGDKEYIEPFAEILKYAEDPRLLDMPFKSNSRYVA